MDAKQQLQTGTTLVAIVCKDGVIVGADMRTTAGHFIVGPSEKVRKINDSLAIAGAGIVSDIQLIVKMVRAEIKLKEIKDKHSMNVRATANMISGVLYNMVRSMPFAGSEFLLVGKDDEGYHSYTCGFDGSLKEQSFTSTGSGMMYALSVLDQNFKENMTIKEGVELAKKAIHQATIRDNASGQGIVIATITDKGYEEAYRGIINYELQ